MHTRSTCFPPRVVLLFPTLLLSLILCGCHSTDGQNGSIPTVRPNPATQRPTGIQPGERLDVFVMEDDGFSAIYSVRSTGDVIFPAIGRIPVKGLSAADAEKAIAKALEQDKLTKATVLVDRLDVQKAAIRESSGVEIFLTGRVARAGRFRVTGIADEQPTVHQAILQAGGLSRFANQSEVHILRRRSDGTLARINADLEAIISGEIADIPLAPGDIVVVPEKMIDFGL